MNLHVDLCPLSPPKRKTTAEAVLFFKEREVFETRALFKEREVFETRALQTPPELHAIAPTAYPDGNRCKANPSTSAKKEKHGSGSRLIF